MYGNIQVYVFNDGSFVLHKVELPGRKGHFSAWYSDNRTLLDAEQHTSHLRTTSVQRDRTTWKLLQEVGRKVIITTPTLENTTTSEHFN